MELINLLIGQLKRSNQFLVLKLQLKSQMQLRNTHFNRRMIHGTGEEKEL